MEGASTHFDVGIPYAGGVIRTCGDLEGVEAVQSSHGDESAVELPTRIVHLQCDGMRVGDALLPVFQDEGDVQRVSRTPYATFAVDEAFQSFLYLLPAGVEAAGGEVFSGHHAQVALLLAVGGADEEGHAVGGDFGKALRIGLSCADGLELEVVDGDVCSFHGAGGEDVADGYPEPVHRIALGDDPQVRGIDIAGGHTAAVHIIRRMARIVLLPPVVEAPVILHAAVVVEVALRHVPFRLVSFG